MTVDILVAPLSNSIYISNISGEKEWKRKPLEGPIVKLICKYCRTPPYKSAPAAPALYSCRSTRRFSNSRWGKLIVFAASNKSSHSWLIVEPENRPTNKRTRCRRESRRVPWRWKEQRDHLLARRGKFAGEIWLFMSFPTCSETTQGCPRVFLLPSDGNTIARILWISITMNSCVKATRVVDVRNWSWKALNATHSKSQ